MSPLKRRNRPSVKKINEGTIQYKSIREDHQINQVFEKTREQMIDINRPNIQTVKAKKEVWS